MAAALSGLLTFEPGIYQQRFGGSRVESQFCVLQEIGSPHVLVSVFDRWITPPFQKGENLRKQIDLLRGLRDLLLTSLMGSNNLASGSIVELALT